jgi:hypothetical protein
MAERLRLSQKTVDRYKDWLTLGHRRFDAEARPIIEKMRAYLLGQQWPPIDKDGESIPRLVVNLIFADIKVMLPTLALRNPRIFVKPTGATVQIPQMRPDGQPGEPVPAQIVNGQPVPLLAAARAKEALINWRWRDLRVTQQVRRSLVDALCGPFGIVKLGYTVLTEKLAPEDGEQLEVNELIKGESPFAVRWSPLDFRVDPEARYPDLSDAEWVAFGSCERLQAIQKNPKYRNTRELKGTVDVRTDYAMTGTGGPGTQGLANTTDLRTYTEEPDDYRRVQLWTVWDKREGKIITLADGHDKALQYDDWPLIHKGFPCQTLCFTEHPDLLYGPPDLYQVLGQQDAYNEVASMSLNHVKRFLRKYITQRGAFDPKELAKLLVPIDGLVIEAEATELANVIMPIPDAPIPVDWWQTQSRTRDDHDRVSGVADFVRGVAEKVDTATEASLLQSNLNVRTNDTRNLMENFAERIAADLLLIDAQTLNLPRAIPVIGPDGAMALNQFVHVQSQDTLLAQTDVEVEIGSMMPINQQTRKKDVLEVYTLLRNDPLVDQVELRQRLIPAYRDSIPDLEGILLSRDQAEVVLAQMALQGAGSPGAAPGGPARPAGPRPVRPGGLTSGRAPGSPIPAARPGAPSGPPVPGSEAS